MARLRVAVSTKAYAGLEDAVSEVFGKAKTFTIVDVENGKPRKVRVIENPAGSYDYGSGPVAAKTLADLRVDFVVATELGLGASGLLKHHSIRAISARPGTIVASVIEENFGRTKSKKSSAH